MFGMTSSWKREFKVNEFIIFFNKLDIIIKNVIENDIKTGTSSKGYMTGFTEFTEVIGRMKKGLKNEIYVCDEVSIVVDVDHNQPLSVQIEHGLVGVIKRKQQPILRLMQMFGTTESSDYCYSTNSILYICLHCQHLNIEFCL